MQPFDGTPLILGTHVREASGILYGTPSLPHLFTLTHSSHSAVVVYGPLVCILGMYAAVRFPAMFRFKFE